MTHEEIVAAVLADKPIVLSEHVLGHRPGERLPAPPPVMAAAEEYPPQKGHRRGGGPRCLTLEELEALSLAARAKLLNLEPSGEQGWSANFEAMPKIDAAVLKQAILDFARTKRASGDRSANGPHITGAHIVGDLDLTNARLPFSLRLSACAIDGCLRLGRAELVTLDLSGSAVRGIHGSFLRARGSIRMRRLTSTGAIDFGGLKVADVFDASDLLVFPWDDWHPRDAFAGDRGIFNLSLATLRNEMRLIRARIYGGLTMKGCRIERSLFLDDAILRAPIAYLERVGADVAERAGVTRELNLAVRTAGVAEQKLAKERHGNPAGLSKSGKPIKPAEREERERRIHFETLGDLLLDQPFPLKRNQRLLRRLLAESVRARTSALRADGLFIKGSIFARSIRSSGLIRAKYARIGGSLHLEGARMRSAEDIAFGLEDVTTVLKRLKGRRNTEAVAFANALEVMLRKTRDHAEKMEALENVNYALDLREAQVAGHVRLRRHRRRGDAHALDPELRACVDLALRDVPAHAKADWTGDQEWHMQAVYVNGQFALEGTVIGGDLSLNGILANLHNVKDDKRALKHDRKDAFLLMEQCTVRGEIDLRSTVGIHGIEAQHAIVASRVRFASHSVRAARAVLAARAKPDAEPVRDLYSRALLLGGTLRFMDSRIGGDAVLLFHRDDGPMLLLARSRIEGRLHILPAVAATAEGDSDDWRHYDERRRTFSRRPLGGQIAKTEDDQKDLPEVDLRSVRAAEFGHSPAAWPHEDQLQIEGFVYEQTTTYGPLTSRERLLDKKHPYREYHFWTAFGVAVLLALVVGGVVAWVAGSAIDFHFGIFNVAALLVALGVIAAQIVIGNYSHPTRAEAQPRAIHWLGLQKASQSVYKMKALTIPLQPYVQAGKVLRSSGQIISANIVEVDRLRRRHEQLSWRNNWYARSLLLVADWVTKFGFDPIRTIGVAVVCGAFFACIFHAADRDFHMRPIDGDLMQIIGNDVPDVDGERMEAGTEDRPSGEQLVFDSAIKQHPNGTPVMGGPAARVTAYPPFSSSWFALDIMVPGLDLGQEQYWRPMASPALGKPRSKYAHWFALSAPILKIIGWLLTTAIAISLLTRVEAMIARHEE